ncbi:MAG: hypothetical protein AVO33_11070 [delta proteobacterium ML8_F1]|nr:MAG: hypothetical protein AVO33_11070 [delta proteobacterium ML8_F1]
MPFGNKLQKHSSTHLKSDNTLREEAKEHFSAEKKEMDHELQQLKKSFAEAFKAGYVFEGEEIRHNHYHVTLVHPQHKKRKKMIIRFEPNHAELKTLWQ